MSIRDRKPRLAVFDMVTAVGGVQQVMMRLLPCLQESYDIRIIDPYENGEYRKNTLAEGLRYESFGHPPGRLYIGGDRRAAHFARLMKRSPWLIMTAARLKRWVAQQDPDIVYFNQLRSAVFFSRFLPSDGPMLVYHAHGFSMPNDPRWARLLSRRFDHIFAVSNFTRTQLLASGVGPSKIRVIPNAVDIEKIQRSSNSSDRALPARPGLGTVFVQIGAISPNKGQLLAVEALSQLPGRSTLWLCGEVPQGGDFGYMARIKKMVADRGLEDRVAFLGWRDDVPAILAAADVCLQPSVDYESFGLSLLEAMALAKPCIGTRVGGIPEVIEADRTGLIVPPSPDALAAAMKLLEASATMRREFGREGFARANRLFDIRTQARRVLLGIQGVTDLPVEP